MPTFLRSPSKRTPSSNSNDALTKTRCRLPLCLRHRAFVVPLLLLALNSETGVQAALRDGSVSRTIAPAASSLPQPHRKRVLMLRRSDSPDGSRFTLMSDAPLDDYKSYAEGERLCVMIPQAALVSPRDEGGGRGFADMRVEERDGSLLLSFRLQLGATVAVNQSFNRLEVIFLTNERVNEVGLA